MLKIVARLTVKKEKIEEFKETVLHRNSQPSTSAFSW